MNSKMNHSTSFQDSPALNSSTLSTVVVQHDASDLSNTKEIDTIDYDSTFDTSADLEEYMKNYADKKGFDVIKSFTNKEMKISEESESVQICVRGYFLCKQCKNEKSVSCEISNNFVVRFSRRDSDKKYYLKETSILRHNHSIPVNKRIIINDNELIKHKNQISKHELYYFHNIGPHVGASKLKHILSLQFPAK